METLFNFSEILKMLKKGKHVARKGWNGKHLEVLVRKGYPNGIPCNESTAKDYGLKEDDLFFCNPYFQIHNKEKNTVDTWVPSVSDLFAEDWYVL